MLTFMLHAASVFQDRQKYFLKTDFDSAWRVLHGDYACIGSLYELKMNVFLEDICFLSNTLIFIRKKRSDSS